ncbi:FkbM family methyltransferase [Candidatus Poribacteria bacterium]|nr:FkbM family methyltransferase [Candidatus Poribacteria bacterium]
MAAPSAIFRCFRALRTAVGGRAGRGYARLPVVGAVYRALYERLKPRGTVVVPFRGFHVQVDASDPTHAMLLMGMDFNDPEIELLEQRLKPGMTVVDVGANVGCLSLVMARQVGRTGKVFAFEPGPDNYARLVANVARNHVDVVVAEGSAVTDEVGETTLYLSAEACGDHSIRPGESRRRSVIVPTTSLDAYLGSASVRPDFVKIDVQGAEGAVLRGMQSVLKARPLPDLLLEFDPAALSLYGDDPAAVLLDLTTRGYVLHHVLHDPKQAKSLRRVTAHQALEACRAEGRHINLFCTDEMAHS